MAESYRYVKTPLRPVYAGYFPRFNLAELESRCEYLEPHLVTQLNPYNIVSYSRLHGWQWFTAYLQQKPQDQRSKLLEVLEYAGISVSTLRAMSLVDRLPYCPSALRSFAYINWSIPILRGTCLSAPGIVAIMCDMVPEGIMGTALEIGLGTGYHALVMLRRNRNLRIVGFEPVRIVYRQAVTSFAQNDIDGVKAFNEPWTEATKLKEHLDLAFQTTVSPNSYYENVMSELPEGGIYILPRPLLRDEFYAQPADVWLHSMCPSYHDYVEKGYRRSCALVRLRKHDRQPVEDARLYGVTFVTRRETPIVDDSAINNAGLEFLLREFTSSR
jgi:protein-L-isoaspartate O-methyltransferase